MNNQAPQAARTPYQPQCDKLNDAPKVPCIREPATCPAHCDCPPLPGGAPQDCLDTLIKEQSGIVKKAERSALFAAELTAIQDKVDSAKVDYTAQRFTDLRVEWKEQDRAICELVRKLVCAVDCWECLLECQLCRQLVALRRLEDKLNGPPERDVTRTGPLPMAVTSLLDQQAWHQRNVGQMAARLERFAGVLAAWENPSARLGEVIEKNASLIIQCQNLIASDSAKVVYDVFMTLIPRHWAIRPRDEGAHREWKSAIDARYVHLCTCPAGAAPDKCQCDDGIPDECCGPDVGIPSLRARLIGPLPYLIDAADFPAMVCCLITNRLSPASAQLAAAQADLAASTVEIDTARKDIVDGTAGIEAAFKAGLTNPIDCTRFTCKPAAAAS